MPLATKQSPTPKRAPAKAGSVLSEAIPIEDVNDEFLQMVVYGGNRVGKTTLACTFPKPLLLVAMEPNRTGGAMSVRKVPGVTYLRLSEKDKIVRLAVELKSDNHFKTIVLDSATSLQDIVLKEILDLPALPEILAWGTVSMEQYRHRSEQTREVLRPFLNLQKHVVILGKEKDHNRDKERPAILDGFQQESFIATDLGGATAGWLHDACDYVCRLSIEKVLVEKVLKLNTKDSVKQMVDTGKTIRKLRTTLHPNFAAGFRAASREKIPEFIDEPTFEKIYAVIKA